MRSHPRQSRNRTHASLGAAAVVCTLGACTTLPPEASNATVAADPLALTNAPKDGLFEDEIPEEYRTVVVPGDKGGLHFDAEKDRRLFPMPREPRAFGSTEELVTYAEKHLYAERVEGKQPDWGFRVHTTQNGDSFWLDVDTEVVYRVTDPAMALLGGVSGRVVAGNQVVCVDGRKDCESGLASYLEPVAEPTAPTHTTPCGDPDPLTGSDRFCAEYHSFFNKVDLCWFRYARHGGNTRTVRNDGGSTWVIDSLTVCGPDAPGAIDIGAWIGRGGLWICLRSHIEALAPMERTIAVIGPGVGSDGGAWIEVDGPPPTTSGFTESAVTAVTGSWPQCGPGTVEIDATRVCSGHFASPLESRNTGNGPTGHSCPP